MNLKALPFFQHIKWQPDRRELRRFAIAMLIGFSLLGLFAAWRASGISTGSVVLWTIGLVLAISALIPGLGKIAYLAVYIPTSLIGYVISNILLALMFFVIITPLAVVLRLFGKDLLHQKRVKHRTYWTSVDGSKSEDSYYRQF